MAEPLKHFPVNWVDGMKIKKQHFIDTENAMLDQIRDALSCGLNALNYGLLPPKAENKESLRCWFINDNQQQWRIKLTECRAVTPGGGRIEIPEHTVHSLKYATTFPEAVYTWDPQHTESAYYVLMQVNPFNRQPSGEPLLEEDPPRLPYATSEYSLYVAPASQLPQGQLGSYQMVLARIIVADGRPQMDDDYIPPCSIVSAHPSLIDLHHELDQFLGQMELYGVHIIQKIYGRNQNNDLALVVLYITEKMVQFLGTRITQFRWLSLNQTPAQMLEIIAGLARTMKNAIDQRAGAGKEELLNYLSEWCELRQGELENLMINCANIRYKHLDVRECLQPMIPFVRAVNKLFESLSRLDYIGRKQDGNIFVKEESQEDSEYLRKHKTKRWFFTD
ncbi:hypothetical protein CLV51_103603 [Chitinophaga niastensis]|uniref:Type VI secretion system baseplate subunit TssK n=1 Tax=Chitinophaga niastensis TaxID=536980 RepID=A0A2P8HK71_CHINA|nr:hypothetical protein [Chitinophaga niastensis]PSL46622.1 hypothetical protein CLV51_103603 [Chitinophaga niastensis]